MPDEIRKRVAGYLPKGEDAEIFLSELCAKIQAKMVGRKFAMAKVRRDNYVELIVTIQAERRPACQTPN